MTLRERFNARLRGDGAHTVVFGHGFGENQATWDEQVAYLLEAGVRVLTFDFAGATEQTLPAFQTARHRSLFGFAEDLSRLMNELAIRDATYVGHSLGGMVGLLTANGTPEAFNGLLMIASSARYLDDPDTGYQGGFDQVAIDQLIAAMQSDYASWANGFAPIVVADPDQTLLTQEFTRALLTLRPDIATTVLCAAFRSDHRRDVAHVRIPTCVLQTEFDPAVSLPAAEWLAEHSHADRLAIIQTRGHFPHRSAAAAVNSEIIEFLIRHGRI